MSLEEQVAQLTIDVQQRDASIVGLVDAVHTYEAAAEIAKTEIASLKEQVQALTEELAKKDALLKEYKDALIEQLSKLLK